MPTLYIRNVSTETHNKLRERASRQHRSIGAEVLSIVEQTLEEGTINEKREEALRRIEERRKKLVGVPVEQDTLTMLREDRAR